MFRHVLMKCCQTQRNGRLALARIPKVNNMSSLFKVAKASFVEFQKEERKRTFNRDDYMESAFDEEYDSPRSRFTRREGNETNTSTNTNSSNYSSGLKKYSNDSLRSEPIRSQTQYSQIIFKEYKDDHISFSQEDEQRFYEEHTITVKSKEKSPKPLTKMADLQIDRRIAKYLSEKFPSPTPIQSVTWPIAQKGINLVGVAETGSGKTLSFVMPALNHIANQTSSKSREGPIALIVAPTRELAMQIHKVAKEYADKVGFRTACLYGGAPKGDQIRQVVGGVELVVATPGRLLDLISYGKTNLNRTSFVVLDEADRMLDMGFEKDLRRILSQVHPQSQTLMWSATWPKEIVKLAEEFLKNYTHVKIGKNENGLAINNRIKQNFIFCHPMDKNRNLEELLKTLSENQTEEEQTSKDKLPKCIVFTNQKYRCDHIVHLLKGKGIYSDCIHGDKSQSERDMAINRFRRNDIEVLVATDVAARGLDINDVKVVINYDFPNNIEDYVHRIGRTGRSGKTGISYAFFTREDNSQIRPLKSLLMKAGQDIPQDFDEAESNHSKRNTRSRSSSSRGPRGGNSYEGRSRYSNSSSRSYQGEKNTSRFNDDSDF